MKKLVLQITFGFFIRYFLKVIVGVRFSEAKFLSKEKQFIIVANHNSHLDTMSLMASVPRSIVHRVRPVAAQDHFGKTKVQEVFSNFFINTLLITRKRKKNNSAVDPVSKMIQALDDGYSLIIFPEGTRGEPGKEQPLKPGVALVLRQRPEVKYVPVFMTGMGNAMPKGDSLIVPYNAHVTYGAPKKIMSTNVEDILTQIHNDLNQLKQQHP
ncbi:MAG TPA: lysophospholipid acyltransferase family protein [Cyclobacteriaceae bacterium]|nr:lysophospholipid acyltransferase family protein [Cyclobacteriaceae bacterium]